MIKAPRLEPLKSHSLKQALVAEGLHMRHMMNRSVFPIWHGNLKAPYAACAAKTSTKMH